MNFNDYLTTKNRNKTKKLVRKAKPYLIGQQLDAEVDRVLGIVHSGKMDWAEVVAENRVLTTHSDPKSIGYDEVLATSKEYGVRPYVLYWFFKKKVTKLEAAGRGKSDYLAVLKDIASSIIRKELSDEEKISAIKLYSKDLTGATITQNQAIELLLEGKL